MVAMVAVILGGILLGGGGYWFWLQGQPAPTTQVTTARRTQAVVPPEEIQDIVVVSSPSNSFLVLKSKYPSATERSVSGSFQGQPLLGSFSSVLDPDTQESSYFTRIVGLPQVTGKTYVLWLQEENGSYLYGSNFGFETVEGDVAAYAAVVFPTLEKKFTTATISLEPEWAEDQAEPSAPSEKVIDVTL